MLRASAIATFFVTASVLAFAAPAFAQNSQPAGQDSTIAPGDIIVTAQRRAERLQDVPLSITAVTADTLKNRDINSLTQLASAAPSLQIGKDNSFSIRGAGTLAFANSLESSVAVSQDEVNLVNNVLASPGGAFYDIQRVEVLSGPQGLLFGKNASAGLINIITNRPVIGETSGNIDITMSDRDTVPTGGLGILAQGTLNLPVTTNSALRLNAFYSGQDANLQFVGSGSGDMGLRQYGGRVKYLINLSDALSFYVIGDYNEEHGIAGYFEQSYRSLKTVSPAYPLLQTIGITPGPDNLKYGGDGDYYRDVARGGLQGKIDYTTDSGIEISDIAAWKAARRDQNFDTDGTNMNGADINNSHLRYHQFTNELRATLPEKNRLSGQAGLYYYMGQTDFAGGLNGLNYLTPEQAAQYPYCVNTTNIGTGTGQCTRSNAAVVGQDRTYSLESRSYAAFGQLTYELVHDLKAFAGGRVTHDVIDIDLAQNQGSYYRTLGVPLVTTAHYAHTNFSYKAGAQYNFTRDIMIYGSYGHGYKGPGFAENVPKAGVSPVVKPETNDNIEVGLKSQWFDHRLTFNISAFRSKFKNYQAQSFNANLGSFVIQNAASVTSKGVEISTIVEPINGLTFTGSGTFLDSKFDDFKGAQCYAGQPDASCAVDNTFNAGGLTTPVSPHFAGALQARYEWAITSNARMFVEANGYHRSSVWYDMSHAPGTQAKAQNTLGLSFGINDNHLNFSIFCKNCTDERNVTFLGLASGEANNGRIAIQQQYDFSSFRTIGMKIGYQF